MDASETITVSWTTAAKAEQYDLQLYPAGTDCLHTSASCQVMYGTSFTFSPSPDFAAYSFRVRAINTTCGIDEYGAWSSLSTFTLMSEITGAFYHDPLGAAGTTGLGGQCSLAGAAAISPGSGASIDTAGRDDLTRAGLITGTTYRNVVPYWPSIATPNNIVTLTPGTISPGVDYVCTCPAGCHYGGIASPQTGVNFYLRSAAAADGWWQVFGGHSYAVRTSGAALISYVPTLCTSATACIPAVHRKDTADTSESAGFAMTGGGDIDTRLDVGSQTSHVTDRTAQTFVRGTKGVPFREGYDYFYRRFSLGASPPIDSDDFAASANDARKPTTSPRNGKAAYFHSGNLTIRNPWHVRAADAHNQLVIFVDGDLILTDPSDVDRLLQVDQGAFLAFIVSGNILVEANVGNATLVANTPNLEGVFIADGELTVASQGADTGGDDTFVGAGTFVGWGGVNLERDYKSTSDPLRIEENSSKAVERFIYRPDFVVNIPEPMTAPLLLWQETN